MRQDLTTAQIREVCRELLQHPNSTSVRSTMRELRKKYGACGRTERVAEILRQEKQIQLTPGEPEDLVALRSQLLEAQRRAERAEERERRHQDFWAARYQEKVAEWQAARAPAPAGVSSEQYLRLYVRAMELARRLAQYEDVESLLPPK
jgi:hypothetical protein